MRNSDSGGDTERLSRRERIENRQRDISDGIADLETNAANEQVERLAGLLRKMDTELKRLEARNRQLSTRLKKVEAVNGLSGGEIDLGDVSALDHRDEKVVKAIVADGVDLVSLDGLAVALEYASEYVDGTVNHRIAARELDLSPLEAEIILQALEPVATEYADAAA